MDPAARSTAPLWEDEELTVTRRWDGERSVLVVSSTTAGASRSVFARWERAYALRALLSPEWATQPLELRGGDSRPSLILHDPGGEILATLTGSAWGVGPALRAGIGIASALRRLHERGLVHRDLKPANILLDSRTGAAFLTGFGLTTSDSSGDREGTGALTGTLAYLAPERTGRVQRSVDSRSDLYSLGVVLYELLTGALPFPAAHPMEWIHCHVAVEPEPLEAKVRAVPQQLSRIVLKLLAKSADHRYQSAHGLERDLERCLAAWEAGGDIPAFVPGTSDSSDRLRSPSRLYGRDQALASLSAAFDRVSRRGETELVLVSGYSGIGKSSLVHHIRAGLASRSGLFATGKFDQHKQGIPYATLTEAFTELLGWVLTRPEQELSHFRHAAAAALGDNGQLVCSVIPRLEQLIGRQPPVAELPAREAHARFQRVFSRFVAVFAAPARPLLLFLDDLQWVDSATLDLLEHLLTQARVPHLLLVGAYRDNEVGAAHPLRARLGVLKGASAKLEELHLTALDLAHVNELVSDALGSSRGQALPLSELILARTHGNPFFIIQFLQVLGDERLLAFDHGSASWGWDLERIRAKGHTDNVVDLMLGKLHRLPAATQSALKRLACLGVATSTQTLQALCASSEAELHAALDSARELGLVQRGPDGYAFSHDRVQEAAYALMAEDERAELHLLAGQQLAAATPGAEKDASIFELVHQFNQARARLVAPVERAQVAELNLAAAQRAKAGTAYAAALDYVSIGRALVAEASWDDRYELCFALDRLRAECLFLTGELRDAEADLERLSSLVRTPVHLAAVTCLKLDLFTVMDRSDRGVEAGLAYLRTLGVSWSAHPAKARLLAEYADFRAALGDRSIESLAELPLMTDPVVRATMDVLTKLQVPALFSDENLHGIVLGRMANLSLAHGNSDGSCFAYSWLAGFVGPHLADYESAPRLARLSMELVQRPGLGGFKARVYCVLGYLVTPWIAPLGSGRGALLTARETARAEGDLTFVAYTSNHLVTLGLGSGSPLAELALEAEQGRELSRAARFGLVTAFFSSQLTLIRGLCDAPDDIDTAELEERLERDPQLAIAACWHFIRRLQLHYSLGDYEAAARAAAKAAPLLWTSTSSFERAEYEFFAGLNAAARASRTDADDRSAWLDALSRHHAQIAGWAEHCPANFAHRARLLSAERARLAGETLEAQDGYETALAGAREQGFVHDEGLAFELASRFYAARGLHDFAAVYQQRALDCYRRWGARALVAKLELGRATASRRASPTAMMTLPFEPLAQRSVAEMLRAVSSELDPDQLLERLMSSALEHALADRGLLILGAESPRIRAAASMRPDEPRLARLDAAVTPDALPQSVLAYVLRTEEQVVIGDTSDANLFWDDPYLQRHRARALVCLPIIYRSQLLGVLYLENGLTPHAFSPEGLAVLGLLTSQAAFSLENARLFSELRQAKVYMGHAERLSRTGSFSWKPREQQLYCSDEVFRIFGVEPGPGFDLLLRRFHPDDRASFESLLAEPSRLANSPIDQRLLLPDGSVRHVSVVARRLEGSPDESPEYVGTLRDVTEIRVAEESLQRTQLALADVTRVASLGEMAAAIAHEVNQPLAAVGLNASTCLRWLAADTPNLPEARAAATRISRDAKLAADVIRRLRQLFDGSGSAREAFDVNAAVREVVALAQGQGRLHGAVIVTQLSPELPPYTGDRVQLQQVVMNLLVNAAESTRGVEGRAREVQLRTHRTDSTLCIDVADTGVGISAAEASRIFDAFYTTKPHGMGIGLSICNTIVQSHGGTLSVEANSGPGSTFRVRLPLTNAPA